MSGLGEYNIGDYIEAELKEGGRLRGTIKKIVDDPDRGYAYLVLDNGWAVHPDEYQYCRDGDMIYKHLKRKFKSIDDLLLEDSQKRCVLEWLAWKFYDLLLKLGIEDGYCKSYDPLLIEDDKCHSYVFDLGDGGRHHPYKNLREIEDKLFNEVVKRIKEESVH